MGSDASVNGAKPFSLFGLIRVLEAWGKEEGSKLGQFSSILHELLISLSSHIAHDWEVNMIISLGVFTLGHFDDFSFLDIYVCLWLILYGVLFILKIHHVWVIMF
jgi:hypothetical protein